MTKKGFALNAQSDLTNTSIESDEEKNRTEAERQRTEAEQRAKNGALYPTPKKKTVSKHFVFGPKEKNSTQMCVFFRDGSHMYALSPANYHKIKRLLTQAQDIGQTKVNVSLVAGEVMPNTSPTHFIWKYAKIAIPDHSSGQKPDTSLSKANMETIRNYPRILLCQSIHRALSLTQTEEVDNFGVYVPLEAFLNVASYLYVENIIETHSDKDDY